MKTKEKPPCPTCNGPVVGKQNKDFCSDECRSKHHQIAEKQTKVIQKKEYNKFIKRNYTVLFGVMQGRIESIVLHRNVLFEHGFNQFEFLNDYWYNGKKYRQIEDFAFRCLNNGKIEVICLNKLGEVYAEFINRWLIHFPEGFELKLQECLDGIFRFFMIKKLFSGKKPTVRRFIHGELINISPPPH